MQHNTPEQILLFIKTHEPVTSAAIAVDLHLTKADIRYHLRQLSQLNLVEEVSMEQSRKRGRPARLFRLPISSQPMAIRKLVSAWLTVMEQSDPTDKLELILKAAKAMFNMDINQSPSAAIRMAALMSEMNKVGYQPHWEIRSGNSWVFLNLCPFRDMVVEHPVLCEIDRQAIHSTSRGEVKVEGLIADGVHPQCIFRVKLPESVDLSDTGRHLP